MRVWTSEDSFDFPASVVALGTFDGVHIGHQELVRQTIELAQRMNAASVVCTFDRHPLSVLCPERAPKQLMTLEEKIDKFAKLGIDGVLVQRFTLEYAATDPVRYLEDLVRSMCVKGIVAGFNYTFGDKGKGNADVIRANAERLGYKAIIVAPVREGDETVSSTLVRSLITDGSHERARRLLRITEEQNT